MFTMGFPIFLEGHPNSSRSSHGSGGLFLNHVSRKDDPRGSRFHLTWEKVVVFQGKSFSHNHGSV